MYDRLVIACGTADACEDCEISSIQNPEKRQHCVEAAQLLIDGMGQGESSELPKKKIRASIRVVTGRRFIFPADMVEAVGA